METISLDQLHVFLTVVEIGSFSGAARRLKRAQSAISYAIGTLEKQLGVRLFDRSRRRPTLTEEGQALLSDARAVARRVDQFQSKALSMSRGTEGRVELVVSVMFPMGPLIEAVRDFERAYPDVALLLRTEALGAVPQLVMDGVCKIGVSQLLSRFPRELQRWPVERIAGVTVAAPTHPLALADAPLHQNDLEQYTQLVLTDRSDLTKGVDHGVVSPRTWRLADLNTKHAFLKAGLGWGNMPIHMVEADLADGSLVLLRVEHLDLETFNIPLVAIYRHDAPPGPASRWLLKRLGARLDEPLDEMEELDDLEDDDDEQS